MSSKRLKTEELSELTSMVFNKYQHLYDIRSKVENKIHLLLGLNTFFVAGFYSIFKEELGQYNILYEIPFLLLIIPILLILVNFYSSKTRAPWIDIKNFNADLDLYEFYKRVLIASMNCAYGLYTYLENRSKLIHTCLTFIGISLLWIAALLISKICDSSLEIYEKTILIFVLVISVPAALLHSKYKLKQYPYREKEFEYKEIIEKYLEERG